MSHAFHDTNSSIPFAPATPIIITDFKVHKPFAGTTKNVLHLQSFLQSLDIIFSTHDITSDYRQISILASNLTDKALSWYTLFASTHDTKAMTYSAFVDEFKHAFSGQVDSYDIITKLSNLKQRNLVDGYIREFLQYRNLLPSDAMSETTLINLFVKGLDVELRKLVRLQPVTTLYETTQIAKRLAHAISNDGGPQFLASNADTTKSTTSSAMPHYPTDADGDVIMAIRQTHHSRRSGRRNFQSNRNSRPVQSSHYGNSGINYRDLYRRTCLANNLCFKCGQAGHQSSACTASNRS